MSAEGRCKLRKLRNSKTTYAHQTLSLFRQQRMGGRANPLKERWPANWAVDYYFTFQQPINRCEGIQPAAITNLKGGRGERRSGRVVAYRSFLFFWIPGAALPAPPFHARKRSKMDSWRFLFALWRQQHSQTASLPVLCVAPPRTPAGLWSAEAPWRERKREISISQQIYRPGVIKWARNLH